MASTPDGGPDGDGSLEVADPDDYNQTRRLRQIHRSRERVEEAILEGREDLAAGDRSRENYDEYVLEALLLYVIQAEPLLTAPAIHGVGPHNETRKEARFWREVEVIGEEDDDGEAESETLVETIEVNGSEVTLSEILENDGEIEDETLSVPDSRKAYRLVNRFLNEVGLGLPFDEGLPEDEL